MEFREVVGYERLYIVSDEGHLYNIRTGNFLKGGAARKGYIQVRLSKDGIVSYKYIHRVVCEAFHGPCPGDGYEVDHVNGDKTDNRACNLRWVTGAQNRAYAAGAGKPTGQRPIVGFNESGDVIRFESIRAAERAGFAVEDMFRLNRFTTRGYAFVDERDFDGIDIDEYFDSAKRAIAFRRELGFMRNRIKKFASRFGKFGYVVAVVPRDVELPDSAIVFDDVAVS